MPTPSSPDRSRRRRLAARIAGARRRAAVVTSAALLAGGGTALTVAPSFLNTDAPTAPASVAEAPVEVATPPPATLLPPVAPVSDVREAPEPTAEAGTPIEGGRASYYGRELAGNPTASGERFDPTELTAAHRTLPLGTRVRVTHARTGESVVVRVNDRGPVHGDRVIDVSRAAADSIGLTRAGTAEVELERLPKTGGARG